MDERRHAQRRHEAALQIGEAFRSIRLARHLSQEQVALAQGSDGCSLIPGGRGGSRAGHFTGK